MENNTPQNAQDGNQTNDPGINLDAVFNGQASSSSNLPADLPASTENTPPAENTNSDNAPNPPVSTNEPAPSGDNQDDILTLLTQDSSLLAADDLAIKNELMTKFGANGVDAKGNLLNDKGQIVLSYDNLNKYIDSGDMLLDNEGNLINELGEVVASAEQINSTNPLDLTREEIEKEYGFKFLDEENKPKSYSNDNEGRRAFVEDVIANTSQVAVASFLENQPELKEIYMYLQNGGDIKDFSSRVKDYSAVDINELNKEQKIAYIRESFEKQNVKNASSMLKLIENAGDEQINQSAAEALLALTDLTAEEKARQEQLYNQKVQEDQKKVEEYWKEVQGVIKQGKLRDLQIPEAEKTDFYKYLASPINGKGQTQEDLDAQKEDTEFNLLVSYLRYKKYDISKLVNDRAGVNKMQRLRERVLNTPRIDATPRRAATNNAGGTGGVYSPRIEELLG